MKRQIEEMVSQSAVSSNDWRKGWINSDSMIAVLL